jgi:hypothetical protein
LFFWLSLPLPVPCQDTRPTVMRWSSENAQYDLIRWQFQWYIYLLDHSFTILICIVFLYVVFMIIIVIRHITMNYIFIYYIFRSGYTMTYRPCSFLCFQFNNQWYIPILHDMSNILH